MKHMLPFVSSLRMGALMLALILMGTIGSGRAQSSLSADVWLEGQSGYTQTLNPKTRPLIKVLADLERQHQVIFDFDSELVKSKLVNLGELNLRSKNLEKMLTDLLTPLDLTYEKFNDRSYLIFSKSGRVRKTPIKARSTAELGPLMLPGDISTMNAPTNLTANLRERFIALPVVERAVTGEVLDGQTNTGLPGVNVVVRGTGIGTSTDADGKFRINVPDGSNRLVFSYVGFITQEIDITGRSSVSVTMTPDGRSLQEVVVQTGYGQQRRSDLTGAIASVGNKELKNLPATDINTALQGRVPGAFVQQTSGEPGAVSNIIIRGPASINGNSAPLYVVDGVPQGNPGYTFNIQDVESIEVLKDASAAAIYGAQAGGGVVLITTKKGKSGQLKVGVSANYGVRNVFNLPELLTRDQYIPAKQAFGFDVVDLYGPQSGWRNLPDTDWLGATYRPGSEENYQVSLAGGNDKSQYYLSGNYNKINGTRIGNWLEKYSLRINSDHQISKRIKFIQTLQATHRNGSPNANANQGPLSFRNTPVMPIYDPTNPLGGWGKAPRGFQGGHDVQEAIARSRNSNGYEFYASGALDVKIVDGLTARALFGTRLFTGAYKEYTPPFDNGTSQSRVDQFANSLDRNQNYVMTYTLNYAKSFGKHNVSALAGYEARRENYAFLRYANQNALVPFPQNSDLVNNVNLATVQYRAGDVDNRILSQFGRVEYNYNDKYLLTVNVRRDGYASKFGPNNKFGVFPGVSAGWKISDEEFMASLPVLSLLKLRAGYGSLGNATQDNFAFIGNYRAGYSYDFGAGRQSGVTLASKVPNPDIRWESINSTNVGIDAGVFNNRLTVNLDYYYRLTNNMLYNIGLPPSAGLGGSVPANVGQLKNTGFEFNLDWRDKAGDVNYGVALNGAFNRNELLSLDPSLGSRAFLTNGSPQSDPYRDPTVSRSAPGQPLGQFYGYQVDGIYQANATATENRPKFGDYVPQAGDLIYRDVNGDGKITEDDKTYIGNPWPKVVLGLNLTAGWKGFDLTAFFSGVLGNKIYNSYESLEHLFFSDYNTTAKIFETSGFNRGANGQPIVAGLPSNGVTSVPRAGVLDDLDKNGNWTLVSSYHVQNGSYVRMRNLQIGYTFPRTMLNKAKMSSLRVFVMGDNLFTITGYKGLNPDIAPQPLDNNNPDNTRSPLQTGIDAATFRYPVSRLMSIGINAEF